MPWQTLAERAPSVRGGCIASPEDVEREHEERDCSRPAPWFVSENGLAGERGRYPGAGDERHQDPCDRPRWWVSVHALSASSARPGGGLLVNGRDGSAIVEVDER